MEWISIKDRQPTEEGYYLVAIYGKDSVKLFELMLYQLDIEGHTKLHWLSGNSNSNKITHWIKCPAIPKNVKLENFFQRAKDGNLTEEEKIHLDKILSNC